MDTLGAFAETVRVAFDNSGRLPGSGAASWEHIRSMSERIDDSFSEGKRNRWLGYIQGVLVSYGVLSLDEVKDINRRYSHDSSIQT